MILKLYTVHEEGGTPYYHWYRKASQGYWGHKPGHTKVINTDNSGYVIYNPQTANRGIYTSWCEYMCVPWPNVSIS